VDEPLVQQCWRVSPGPDFLLVVWAPDMPTFQALTQRLFTQDANVRNVKSFFALKRAKFDPRCRWRPWPTAAIRTRGGSPGHAARREHPLPELDVAGAEGAGAAQQVIAPAPVEALAQLGPKRGQAASKLRCQAISVRS
jgi:hypothetical protein